MKHIAIISLVLIFIFVSSCGNITQEQPEQIEVSSTSITESENINDVNQIENDTIEVINTSSDTTQADNTTSNANIVEPDFIDGADEIDLEALMEKRNSSAE